MVSEMLTTGVAASMLGVSRQHVVDLCDREVLPSVRVGTHRRIEKQAVLEMLGRLFEPADLTREREKSLWLHRAVLGHLMTDPETVIATARRNLDRWREKHRFDGMAQHYLHTWDEILDSGIDTVAIVLVSEDESAGELRQNTPFAGVLSETERQAVLHAFNCHWEGHHQVQGVAL